MRRNLRSRDDVLTRREGNASVTKAEKKFSVSGSLMALYSILNVTAAVVFYLAASITGANSGESEIGELPFCNPDKLNTQHK
jgi:hypothetical protein